MYSSPRSAHKSSGGFTIVEIVAAMVLFPIIVIGLTTTYNALRRSYMTARQLNEIYAVLSACPEIDRALEFSSLTSSTNCYPNNTFQVENTTVTRNNVYTPTLAVTDTTALGGSDPLRNIPDSKVVDIDVGIPRSNAQHFKLRMLITRNGIGQL